MTEATKDDGTCLGLDRGSGGPDDGTCLGLDRGSGGPDDGTCLGLDRGSGGPDDGTCLGLDRGSGGPDDGTCLGLDRGSGGPDDGTCLGLDRGSGGPESCNLVAKSVKYMPLEKGRVGGPSCIHWVTLSGLMDHLYTVYLVAFCLFLYKNLYQVALLLDLFDDEGFSLSAMNGKVQESGGVSFEDCNSDELTSEEEIDLERAKVIVRTSPVCIPFMSFLIRRESCKDTMHHLCLCYFQMVERHVIKTS